MLNLRIETVKHDQQRYETVGDYFYDENGTLVIRVSDMADWEKEIAVAVHELVEWALITKRGLAIKSIDDFDKAFKCPGIEPGDCPHAPYYHEHQIATEIEKILVKELGLNWKDYEDAVNAL